MKIKALQGICNKCGKIFKFMENLSGEKIKELSISCPWCHETGGRIKDIKIYKEIETEWRGTDENS